jgi:cell division protein FtsW (lipid II flippase)
VTEGDRGEPNASAPRYRTGAIWGVLTVLLLFGTVASAFVVYGITGWAAGGRWWVDGPIVVVAGIVALWLMLLITGVLYRIDRLRGTPHRRIELFE